jgi:uncharacterized membrane-anchored protein
MSFAGSFCTRAFSKEIGRVVGMCLLACLPALLATAQEAGPSINWERGPTTSKIRDIAEIQVPQGYQFTAAQGTQMILRLMENPTAGNELGMLMPEDENAQWFIVFEWEECGYVKDDEKDELDADAILKSIREGNDRANEERTSQGWAAMEINGWEQLPAYNPQTNNLEWAIRGSSEGSSIINYNTRILGRSGVMSANLVVDPSEMGKVLPEFKKLLSGYAFQQGKKYADFRQGDKIAKYGLTALVTGGAAAVALKSGLLQKLWKFILLGFVAVAAFFKKIFGAIFGGKE